MAACQYSSIVLDLGGVLFSTANVPVGLSLRQLKNAVDSPIWHEFETGKISQQDCYDRLTKIFSLDLQTWAEAISKLTISQQPNEELIRAIRQLKSMYPSLRILCLSNIPEPALRLLRETIAGWDIIDEMHTSATYGFRKPDLAAFRTFLKVTHNTPESCILVDDRIENVVSARSLGLRAILFQNTVSTITEIHNLLGNSVARGVAYLKQHAGKLFSVTNDGEEHKDNFSQLLILQNTGDR